MPVIGSVSSEKKSSTSPTPAFATKTSTLPYSDTVFCMAEQRLCQSVISHDTCWRLTIGSTGGVRSPTITRAFSARKVRAVASPNPREPPVIKTTLPESPFKDESSTLQSAMFAIKCCKIAIVPKCSIRSVDHLERNYLLTQLCGYKIGRAHV